MASPLHAVPPPPQGADREPLFERRTELAAGHAALVAVAIAGALTCVMWALGSRLGHFELTKISRPFWYVWQLAEPTLASRSSAWTLYVVHQCSIWALIYYAQTRVRRYSSTLHGVNVAALLLNLGFGVLHLAQTHLFYDGLAQDVPEASSLGSVVVMLVMVLMMSNRERGLVFGKQLPIGERTISFLRRYHGYYFAWAITYTFWYHPAVATPGHLLGFAYIFLLMIQGSMFFTTLHTNRYFRLTVELGVVVHSIAVAAMVPMFAVARFAFGWFGLFVLTQMHGLGWSRRTRAWIAAVYVTSALGYYSQTGISHIHEVLRIPIADAITLALLTGLFWLGFKVADQFAKPGLVGLADGALEALGAAERQSVPRVSDVREIRPDGAPRPAARANDR